MKRGGPLRRKTPLRSDPEKRRAFNDRGRSPLPRRSAKQIEIDRERSRIKAQKLADAGFDRRAPMEWELPRVCVGFTVWPEIPCGHVSGYRPVVELHEVVKRSRWRMGAVDPSNSVLLCQRHHDATEAEPAEATRRGLLASHDVRSSNPEEGGSSDASDRGS